MASMTSLNDNIYPIIDGALKTNSHAIIEIQNVVSEYLDRNMNKLSTSGPIYRTLFLDNDKNAVFKATGTSPELVNRVIKESAYIKNHWRNIASPFNVVMALLISWAKRNKNNDFAMFLLMYLVLSMYPSLHSKYFPYEPNPQIMDYTINNLSNKYKIKQQGTVWNALLDTAVVCDKTYSQNIIRATDKDITDYIEAMKTRLNALLKKIKNEFTKNYNDKNIIGVEKDNEDKENYSSAESNSYAVERLANSISLKLAINGIDPKIIQIAAKLNDVAVNDLRTTVNQLVSDKENSKDIKKLIGDILLLFLTETRNSIGEIRSNKFILECLKIYKKSNTGNKIIIEIKKYLDKWLAKYSERYKASNRTATLNSFRRALFTYFVFTIQANVNS